jgi:predicted DNA-binding transcriptional regulator YafY
MKASRLLLMLLELQARGKASARELADRFEVSIRTINRDAGALAEAGIPLISLPGPGGGYRLPDGYRTRLPLTERELQALTFGHASAEAGLGLRRDAALVKLLADVPAATRDRASFAASVFHLDPPQWFREREDSPVLSDLVNAATACRQISALYRDQKRLLEPLGVVLKGGAWYLVAGVAGSVRIYRVARLSAVTVLAQTFARPPDFDLGRFWAERRALFEGGRPTIAVHLRVRETALSALRANVEPAAWASIDASPPPTEDGWIEVTVPFEGEGHAFEHLAQLGDNVEVIAPPLLRRQFVDLARSLSALYPTEAGR